MTVDELYDLIELGFEEKVESDSGRKRMIMNVLKGALKEEYKRGFEDGEDKWRYS